MNRYHTPEYTEYIRSLAWKMKRQQKLLAVGKRCERCGAFGRRCVLQVHHLTYERLGEELMEDLQVLCLRCHEAEDILRRQQVERQSAARLYNARLEGWASKKYGEDWADYMDVDLVEEEFDDWLDRRESGS